MGGDGAHLQEIDATRGTHQPKKGYASRGYFGRGRIQMGLS